MSTYNWEIWPVVGNSVKTEELIFELSLADWTDQVTRWGQLPLGRGNKGQQRPVSGEAKSDEGNKRQQVWETSYLGENPNLEKEKEMCTSSALLKHSLLSWKQWVSLKALRKTLSFGTLSSHSGCKHMGWEVPAEVQEGDDDIVDEYSHNEEHRVKEFRSYLGGKFAGSGNRLGIEKNTRGRYKRHKKIILTSVPEQLCIILPPRSAMN